MLIYDLYPPLVGPGVGWEPHLARARDLGFRWLLVTPVHDSGPGPVLTLRDFRLHPAFASLGTTAEAALSDMIRRARDHELACLASLVLDGCSPDSPMASKYPHWFRGYDDEVLDIGLDAPDSRRRRLEDGILPFAWESRPDGLMAYALERVLSLVELGFAGFLCHAAHRVPGPIWGELIRSVRAASPEVRFLADTLGCTAFETRDMARFGFQAVLNSAKWWDYNEGWLLSQYNLVRDVLPSISFPENHETERLAHELSGNIAGLKQRWFFSALFASGALMPVGYEFGFRRRADFRYAAQPWEAPNCDLSDYIRRVNAIKSRHPVFKSESPTAILPHDNPHVLLMWKGAVDCDQEALLILNKDIFRSHRFRGGDLRRFVVGEVPLHDASPYSPLPGLPRPFEIDLEPGEGRVLVTLPE